MSWYDHLARWCADPATQEVLGSGVSCHVCTTGSGDTVFAHDAAVPRRPGSLVKLVTAVAALRSLGPAHTFGTDVCVDSRGTLYLRGGGDVELTTTRLMQLARDTAAAVAQTRPQTSSPPLRVVVDPSLFPPPTPAPGWRPDYYPLEVRPVVPLALADYFALDVNEAVGEYFAAALREVDVAAEFSGVGVTPRSAMAVADMRSAHVAATVNTMLLDSSNPRAESLFRLTALARGEPASWSSGSAAAVAVLRELNCATAGVVITDGSGLSAHARLRADTVTALLRAIATPSRFPELASIRRDGGLPLAGISGTLSSAHGWFSGDRFAQTRGRIWAKPGIVGSTIALAGLVPTGLADAGHDLAFCVVADQRPLTASLQSAKECVASFATLLTCAA